MKLLGVTALIRIENCESSQAGGEPRVCLPELFCFFESSQKGFLSFAVKGLLLVSSARADLLIPRLRSHAILLDGLHGIFDGRNREDSVWLGRFSLSARVEVEHDCRDRYHPSLAKRSCEPGS